MTATADHALTTPAARADTRPDIHIHPRSASATGRARFNIDVARRLLAAARRHRVAGRTEYARGALVLAGVSRRQAAAELRNVRRGA